MKALRVAIAVATVVACSSPLLASSDPPPGAASCSGCHSAGATASASPIPRIYGRAAGDIVTAMTGFRDGSLPATVMTRIATGFTDDELRAIAAWLAAQE